MYMHRPVEKSCLVKFHDLFAALKDVLCSVDEDDAPSKLLLLYSQCLASYVSCFSNAMKGESEDGELSPPVTYALLILM